MGQAWDEIPPNVAERLCWEVARRDGARVARRLYRQQAVDGADRLDEAAVLDDFFYVLQAIGVMTLLEEVHGIAIQYEMVRFVPYVVLDGLKTRFGIECIKAWPMSLFSDEALIRLVGYNTQQVHQGICQRGATKRQEERVPGPMSPDTLAKRLVKWNFRDREVVFNGAIRALAQGSIFGAKVAGIADGKMWRPPSALAAVARRRARSVWKTSMGSGTILRSRFTAETCSC